MPCMKWFTEEFVRDRELAKAELALLGEMKTIARLRVDVRPLPIVFG